MVAAALSVSDDARQVLERWARSTVGTHRRVVQARGLLLATEGVPNEGAARRRDTTPDTVRRWRAHYAQQCIEGVGAIAPGRGRKSWLRV